MRYWIVGTLLFLMGCRGILIPETYHYKEIQTKTYKIASWQKITDEKQPVRIYIEGDGHAFNYAGYPTLDPTPKGTFLREIAFNDPNPNVVYLARPCQYVKDPICSQSDWTTGRFSQKIVEATFEAVQSLIKDNRGILIGYSGGALLSGLVIGQNPNLHIQKWMTIAGVLNHTKWTQMLYLDPLNQSIDLEKLPNVSQIHYVGEKDKIVPKELSQSIVPSEKLVIVPRASHDSGYEGIFFEIYKNE